MRFALALLLCAACSTPSPTRLSVDIGRFAQTSSPVSSVGLLVISAPLTDSATQQTRIESDDGEVISTTAPEPPRKTNATVELGETNPNMDTGARRAADAPAQTANVATPEVEKSDAARAPFSYFPVSLDPGLASFTVDVPSGASQSLFLYGFGAPDKDGGTPVPNYAAAAVNVALEPGAEQNITFITYPAGVIAPQILTPSLIGLTDAAGNTISAVPEDLSCVAVAHAVTAREGFPVDLTVKIRVGSLNAAAAIGSASVLVVPVGDYQLSCFAQFASKLFAVNPPLDVKVEQGKVTVATGALVKIKDLKPRVTDGGGVEPGVVPPTDPQTIPTTPSQSGPRFSVHLGSEGGLVARQTAAALPLEPSTESNFDNRSGDETITVVARKPDGSFDNTYDGVVVLRVTPALDRTLVGSDAAGGVWRPFSGNTPFEQRLFIVGGVGSLVGGLRLSSLVVPVLADRATMQFVLSAQPLDNAGGLAPVAGAKLFTVRSDLGCRQFLPFASWFAGTLTPEPNELTVIFNPTKQQYYPQTAHVLLAALTAQTGTGQPSRCVFNPSPNTIAAGDPVIFLLPLNQPSRDMLKLSDAFKSMRLPEAFASQDGYAISVPVSASGQTVVFDAITPVLPSGLMPAVGTRYDELGYFVYDSLQSDLASPPQLRLSAVVK